MRKEFLFSALLLLAACSSSDDLPEVPTTPTEPADSTEVVKAVPAEEFLSAFCNGGWSEAEVYDVFADGSTSGNLLTEMTGYVSRSFTVVDEGCVREFHFSDAYPHYFSVDTVSYAYDESVGSLTFSGGKLSFSLNKTFTVLSIGEDELRCEGSVAFGNASAEKGLYVFKRRSVETQETMDAFWQDRQMRWVPLMIDKIDGDAFCQLFEKSGWSETGVYDLYEDGSVGTKNLFDGADGFINSMFYVDEGGKLTEYLLYDHKPSFYETNDATYSFSTGYLDFKDVRHDDLRKVFRVISIDEKEMICVGWPWLTEHHAPGAVRSVYVFERVSDDVVTQWRELWGNS